MRALKWVADLEDQQINPEPGGGMMTGKAIKTFSTAVMERITGEGPGRARAVAASVIAGVAAGGATYRLLRSNAD